METKVFKFKVESADLLNALKTAKLAAANKFFYHLPSMCMVFRKDGSIIQIESYNGHVHIRKYIYVTTEDKINTSFALNGSRLFNAIKMLDNQELEIIVYEYQITVKHSYGTFSIPTEDCVSVFDDFCKTDVEDDHKTIGIESPCLISVLKKCKFAIAKDEYRPVMNNVIMDINEDFTYFAASDARKLIRVRKESITADTPTKILLPKNVIDVLLKTLPKTGFAEIEYSDDTEKMARRISYDNTELIYKQCDGRYPNYNSVMPSSFDAEIKVDRYELIGCLSRVSLFSSENRLFVINMKSGVMELSANDLEYNCSAVETIHTNYHGEDFRIGFNGESFLECLKNIGSSTKVIIKTRKVDYSGTLITPVSQPAHEEVDILLMPMHIND